MSSGNLGMGIVPVSPRSSHESCSFSQSSTDPALSEHLCAPGPLLGVVWVGRSCSLTTGLSGLGESTPAWLGPRPEWG